MPLVSIARFRARSIWFVPILMIPAQRSIAQVRNAKGCLSMALLKDKDYAFWTMTTWIDERSMEAYMTSGLHRKACQAWPPGADEASVVHWHQDHAERPDWNEAALRMKAEGRPSKLRHADHTTTCCLFYLRPLATLLPSFSLHFCLRLFTSRPISRTGHPLLPGGAACGWIRVASGSTMEPALTNSGPTS